MLAGMRSRSKRPPGSKQTELGKRIEAARESAGLKPADLARALGVGNTQVWRWEKGGAEPKAKSLARIAAACGVSLASLLEGEDEPEPARVAS